MQTFTPNRVEFIVVSHFQISLHNLTKCLFLNPTRCIWSSASILSCHSVENQKNRKNDPYPIDGEKKNNLEEKERDTRKFTRINVNDGFIVDDRSSKRTYADILRTGTKYDGISNKN